MFLKKGKKIHNNEDFSKGESDQIKEFPLEKVGQVEQQNVKVE